jgi:hypothetical protein
MRARLIVVLVVALALSDGGCMDLTSSGRQRAAQMRQVRRVKAARLERQKERMAFPKLPPPAAPSEPVITVTLGPDPLAVSDDSAGQ